MFVIVNILNILDFRLHKLPLVTTVIINVLVTLLTICIFGCWDLIVSLQMVLCRENPRSDITFIISNCNRMY